VVALEAGTGSEAFMLLGQRAEKERRTVISSLLRDPQAGASAHLWLARGRLWLAGAGFDWRKCHHEKRYRVPLPTYPFERQRCWIGPPDSSRVAPRLGATATITGEQVRHPRPEFLNPYCAPETEIQKRLAGLWEELLGIESVGIHDNFFDLGGHSLIAVQLVSRLREIFDIAIDPEAVFQAVDIADMAQAIEQVLAQQIAGMTEEEAEALLNENAEQ
jgi:acyl transferase domain-containing protein